MKNRKAIARPIEINDMGVKIRCPYCKKNHIHGVNMNKITELSYEGYRSKHCKPMFNFHNEPDYYIKNNNKLIRKFFKKNSKPASKFATNKAFAKFMEVN